MNKNTSMVLIAAVAGIMVAATLAVTMTGAVFADSRNKDNDHKSDTDITATGGSGGIGGAGGAGGVAVGGGNNAGSSHSDNSASANGGDGGDANGGEAQNCLSVSCRN
jgi:hypothetical protein